MEDYADFNGALSDSSARATYINTSKKSTIFSTEDYTHLTLEFKATAIGDAAVYIEYDSEDVWWIEDIYSTEFNSVTFDIANASIEITDEIDAVEIKGSITTPTKNGTDTSSLTGDNVDVVVTWSPSLTGGTFVSNTEYTAKVTVSADDYYSFASNASVTYDGFNFTQIGDDYVAEKTFDATDDKAVTGVEITTNPTTTTYTAGDSFDPTGMTVEVTYDDGTTDSGYKDYTVSYQGGSYFLNGDTIVTITAGNYTDTVNVSVSGKTPTESLFEVGTTSTSYTGQDQYEDIIDSISLSEDETAIGNVDYTVYKDGSKVNGIVEVGSYTIQAKVTGGNMYALASSIEIGTVTVNTKAITESDFVIDTSDKEYTGLQITPTVTPNTLGAQDYTVNYGENVNVSTGGTITIEGKGNYSGSVIKNFTITPIVLTADDLSYTGDVTKIYDGDTTSIVDEVIVTTVGGLYVSGTTVYNSANVDDADTATFTAESLKDFESGNYVLADDVKLDIEASITPYTAVENFTDIAASVISGDGTFPSVNIGGVGTDTATGDIVYTYNSETKTYAEIKEELAKLEADEEAEVSYTFTGTGNYAGAYVTGTIDITIVDIEFKVDGATATADNALVISESPTYGNTWTDILSINEIEATVLEYSDNSTGEYSLNVTGTPSAGEQTVQVLYSGTVNGMNYSNVVVLSTTIEVAAKTLTVSDLEYTGNITKTYDGTTVGTNVFVNIKDSSLVGDDTVNTIEATVSYNSADVNNANTAALTTLDTVSSANYTLDTGLVLSESASITAKTITVDINSIDSVEYDGTAKEPSITVMYGDDELSSRDYTVSYDNNINVTTTASVTVSDVSGSNYAFTDTTEYFEITKVDYTGTKEAETSVKYGNSGTLDIASILPEGAVLGDISVDTIASMATTPTLSGTVLSYEFIDDSNIIGNQVVITVPVTSTTNFSAYDITVTIIITDKDNRDDFVFENAQIELTYGDTMEIALLGDSSDISYESSDETVLQIVDGEVIILKAGTATITAIAAEDLDYVETSTSQIVTIDVKDLTVSADDIKVLINSEMPELTYTVSDLAYDDEVTTAVTIETTALDTTTPGEYEIIVSAIVVDNMDNYNVIYENAILTVVDQYDITLDANGGTIEVTELTTDVNSNIVDLVDPTRNNVYVFEGWYTATENGEKVTSTTVIEDDMTLYAVWSQRESENSTTIDSNATDLLDKYSDTQLFTEEEIQEINDTIEEVIYDLDKDTAKDDAETIEQIAQLEELFIAANPTLTVEFKEAIVSEDVADDVEIPSQEIEVTGLAIAIFAGEEVTVDTTLFLEVEQVASDDDSIVLNIEPKMEVNGITLDVENASLQSPVTFKLYLNDSFESDTAKVVHNFTDGGSENFTLEVQEDENGKFVVITVSQFSEFIITPVVDTTVNPDDQEEPNDDTEEPSVEPEEPSEEDDEVQTGDSNAFAQAMLTIMVISLAGVIFVTRKKLA